MKTTTPLVLLLAAAVACPATAQRARPRPPRPPALIVHVAVDQMRADYLERFRPQLTGGLARLLDQGAVFTQAYQDHAVTETAPGHSTMLSGRYPYSTGIVTNTEGVSDGTTALVDARGTGASPRRFHGNELLDWLRARWPGTRMLSVSRKDRGAILPVGRRSRRVWVYWFADGKFTTSTYYADTLPGWVRSFNERLAAGMQPGVTWALLRDSADYPERDSVALENRGRNVVFPHVLGPSALAELPQMDSLTLALALDGIRELRLGRASTPDIVSVSLSTLDQVGHEYGPQSREVHDLVLHIDRYLGAFLDSLDRRYGAGRVLVSLTADHGVSPSWDEAAGAIAPAVRVDSALIAFRDASARRLGMAGWLRWRAGGVLALDHDTLAARGVDADSLAAELARRLREVPGVLQVDTRASLAAADTTANAPARRWRRSLFPGGPGDVFITLEPRHAFGRSTAWNHGQPTDDDAHVPLILMGPRVVPGSYTARVAVVDLGPTLAALVGARPTEMVDGRVLSEAVAPR